ncbi:MAG TPA: universal stress protein [Thermoleophilaceae bacterium]|nr:universal stress protein [Thermoleophilaceae bacterium]
MRPSGGGRRSERAGRATEGLRRGPGRAGARIARGTGRAEARIIRSLGEPALFAITLSAIVSAIFFLLGVVAGDALGLTPVVFLVAGVFFAITMATYVEGNSLHPERGGASTFARYAFDELWSFVAGWAILLDYLIVMALAAVAISDYLAAFWGELGGGLTETVIAAAALVIVAVANVRGLTADRLTTVLRLSLVGIALLAILSVLVFAEVFDLGLIFDSVDLGSQPTWEDVLFATVIATGAMLGIEAASGLAGEVRVGRRGLRRVVIVVSAAVLLLFAGVSTAALMAVPVEGGTTALSTTFEQAPVLGMAEALDPSWLSDVARYAVGAVAAATLLVAMNGQMLGLARLGYSLATNRQIPSAVGRLHARRGTPYVIIILAAFIAFGLVAPNDMDFLAGIFAFGAMLTFAIAHLSVIALRFREAGRPSAFRVPLSFRFRQGTVPVPALVGALFSLGAWVSVIVLHEGARVVGGLWMAFGIVLYTIYRRSQGKSLRKRFTIPATALQESPDIEYGSILVPVFGEALDDDIVGTAGRLAAERADDGEGGAVLEVLFVFEIPMSLPIDARVPEEKVVEAKRVLGRAKEVGEEYAGVEVATAMVRGRTTGQAIVAEARRRGVEAIVLAAEEPSRIRGGAILGGRGRARDRAVGETTRYVVEKATCTVILTAPPAGDDMVREGVLP